MRLLVTGCAGFIGFHLSMKRLLAGDTVIGVDNLNPYYDVSLKEARLKQLQAFPNFTFYQEDICNLEALTALFNKEEIQRVVHLAAQAGVRYSLTHPHTYVQSNLVGFTNLIDLCKHYTVEHLVYASTSSVYGANTTQPFREDQSANHPLTLYAASKKANELIAHAYSHLFRLPTTGLRFFTVYGPYGRPDMALFKFTEAILAGKPIDIYNHGHMQRDFTYVDDIVEGISHAVDVIATADEGWDSANPNPATSNAPYRIYNIGCGNPAQLMEYIEALEQALGKEALKNFLPLQAGDVPATHADVSRLETELNYLPKVRIQEGVGKFVDWYLGYYPESTL